MGASRLAMTWIVLAWIQKALWELVLAEVAQSGLVLAELTWLELNELQAVLSGVAHRLPWQNVAPAE